MYIFTKILEKRRRRLCIKCFLGHRSRSLHKFNRNSFRVAGKHESDRCWLIFAEIFDRKTSEGRKSFYDSLSFPVLRKVVDWKISTWLFQGDLSQNFFPYQFSSEVFGFFLSNVLTFDCGKKNFSVSTLRGSVWRNFWVFQQQKL